MLRFIWGDIVPFAFLNTFNSKMRTYLIAVQEI